MGRASVDTASTAWSVVLAGDAETLCGVVSVWLAITASLLRSGACDWPPGTAGARVLFDCVSASTDVAACGWMPVAEAFSGLWVEQVGESAVSAIKTRLGWLSCSTAASELGPAESMRS